MADKILIIEDVESLRNDIMEILSYEQFEVRGAENGRVGLEVAQDFQPDLIVCDIMMPELDGYEVLDAVRKQEFDRRVPFIFLTARINDQRKGMARGAEDFLTKPFETTALLDTIKTQLQKAKEAQAIHEAAINEAAKRILTAAPHEFRTPLNAIIGFSDLLIEKSQNISPESVFEWASFINNNAMRLYRLVENYIMYARLEFVIRNSQEIAALRQNVVQNPDSIVEFYVSRKLANESRAGEVTTDLQSEGPVAMLDQDLGKIVEELFDNAVKFSNSADPILVSTTNEPGCFVLQVTDHGRGMTQDQIDHIGPLVQFERPVYEHQGSGLGLAIVKRLSLEIYSGVFEIQSEAGKWTTVTVKIPMAQSG